MNSHLTSSLWTCCFDRLCHHLCRRCPRFPPPPPESLSDRPREFFSFSLSYKTTPSCHLFNTAPALSFGVSSSEQLWLMEPLLNCRASALPACHTRAPRQQTPRGGSTTRAARILFWRLCPS